MVETARSQTETILPPRILKKENYCGFRRGKRNDFLRRVSFFVVEREQVEKKGGVFLHTFLFRATPVDYIFCG